MFGNTTPLIATDVSDYQVASIYKIEDKGQREAGNEQSSVLPTRKRNRPRPPLWESRILRTVNKYKNFCHGADNSNSNSNSVRIYLHVNLSV
jgi:hypothetical protein